MNQFSKYLDNIKFINWVYNPTVENNKFWESYLKEYPNEKEIIGILKNILDTLKTENEKLTEKEKEEILSKILIKLERRKKKVFKLPTKLIRYAAMIVFMFGLGLYFINITEEKNEFSFEILENTSIDSITETQLILTSGKKLLISSTKSTVQFTNLGDIIVNKNDTVNSLQVKVESDAFNQLIVPYGKRSKVLLADGSIVHLNAGTRFVFPKEFKGKQRKVFLDGEAFFEIASNTKKPFIVKTLAKDFEIEVIGTKFNVTSYASDSHILTVLKEGEVHIKKKMNSFYSSKTKLKPGELAIWNKQNSDMEVKVVDTDFYTLWTEGLLQFKSQSIQNVAKKLERFYNIEIDIEESLVNDIRISGKLDLNDQVEKTLENFALTLALKVEKINNKKYNMK